MAVLSLDGETRSEVPIKNGLWPYFSGREARLLCLAGAIDDDPVSVWIPGSKLPTWYEALRDPTTEIRAWNAGFERLLLKILLPSWPQPKLTQWRCTAVEASSLGLPRSLEKAAEALGSPIKKDKRGAFLINQLCVPRKITKTKTWVWRDDANLMVELAEYCCQDVDVERGIKRRLLPLCNREWALYAMDQGINDTGVAVDVEMAKWLMTIWKEYESRLNLDLRRVTNGAVWAASKRDRLLEWVRLQGVDIPNLTSSTIEEVLDGVDAPEGPVKRALEIRAELARASVKKYVAFGTATDADGRLRGSHVAWGAHTGRWTNRGVQLHNLVRGSLSGNGIEQALQAAQEPNPLETFDYLWGGVSSVLTSLVRSMLVAKPGHKLLVSDFSSIEARGLAMLAHQDDLLEEFRSGADTYVTLASKIYGVPVEEVKDYQRQIGKIARLGLGYGMGPKLFMETCHKNKAFIDAAFAEQVVDLYRKESGRIKSWWYELNDAAIRAIKSGNRSPCRGGAFSVDVMKDPVTMRKREWLRFELPSGRYIAYPQPHLGESRFGGEEVRYWGVDSDTYKWRIHNTYGGKLAENITQGFCRDIMAEAMWRLIKAGFSVVLHVHDEVVCEEPIDGRSIQDMRSIMNEVPKWCPRMPIGTSGFESLRYRK